MVSDESRKPIPTGPDLVSSFQVLSLVGDALQLISDGADTTATTRSLTQIRELFERCESTLDRLPGGALTRADQLVEIRRLGDELHRKRALVRKYADHELVAHVIAQKDGPLQKGEEAMEDDAPLESEQQDGDDVIMKMDDEVFADVGGMDKEVDHDVLMGLDI